MCILVALAEPYKTLMSAIASKIFSYTDHYQLASRTLTKSTAVSEAVNSHRDDRPQSETGCFIQIAINLPVSFASGFVLGFGDICTIQNMFFLLTSPVTRTVVGFVLSSLKCTQQPNCLPCAVVSQGTEAASARISPRDNKFFLKFVQNVELLRAQVASQ